MSEGAEEKASEEGLPKLPPHWLSLLLENISDTVLVTDREGRILHWSQGAEKTFQHTADSVLGKHVNLLYVPTEGEELQEAWNLAFDGEIISDVEVQEKRKDGRVITLLLSIVPILGDTGEVEYLAGIGKDITILRGLEERVLASERLETVREMIITLNHKMNQPLAVAGCYLGMLLADPEKVEPAILKEYLGEIEKSLDKVADLLRRIAEMEEVKTVEYLAENRMVDVEEQD